MKTFVTSDTHFGHYKMTSWDSMPKRNVFSTGENKLESWEEMNVREKKRYITKWGEEMDEKLISNWNSVVGEDDLVYHLGDFAFASHKRIRDIVGRLNGRIHLIEGNHEKKKVLKKVSDLFVDIDKYLEIKYNYKKETYFICMFHYPISSWNKKMYNSIHLFGHCHGKYTQPGKCLDVGVDSDFANFYPLSIEDVIDYTKKL